jgi:hypothetical protein
VKADTDKVGSAYGAAALVTESFSRTICRSRCADKKSSTIIVFRGVSTIIAYKIFQGREKNSLEAKYFCCCDDW